MDIGAGFAIHTGWAAAVLVGGDGHGPVVVDRRRVTLCPDALPRQVYHAAQDLPPAKAALLVREVHDAVDALTPLVIDELAHVASSHGELVAVGVTGFPRDVPVLEKVLASHALLHLAEGELYRGAICDAAADRGLTVVPVHPKDGIAEAAHALGVAPDAFAQRLTALRGDLGPPWQADHRVATAAGLAALHAAA
ncbi:MAG: hypothetical protein ACJ739_08680 [Acidimicrobiales bacterium]